MMSSNFRDVAQPGSAHAWGACGRRFKSSRPDFYYLGVSLMRQVSVKTIIVGCRYAFVGCDDPGTGRSVEAVPGLGVVSNRLVRSRRKCGWRGDSRKSLRKLS